MWFNCVNEPDILDFIQAGAAVFAVFAGFAYVGFQRRLDARAAGRAAGRLARHSVDLVTERFAALVGETKLHELALRGARASEMVEAFREFELASLPPEQIELVAVVRSAVFAVNSRIDEVLKDDADRPSERHSRLYSAGRTLVTAREALEKVRDFHARRCRSDYEAAPYNAAMAAFIDAAVKHAEEGAKASAGSPRRRKRGQAD